MRVVPVGVIGEASRGVAAEILGAEDRAGAWFGVPGSTGASRPSPEAAALVGMNGRLLERSGTEFVPYSLKWNEDGSVSAVVGADFGEWFDG